MSIKENRLVVALLRLSRPTSTRVVVTPFRLSYPISVQSRRNMWSVITFGRREVVCFLLTNNTRLKSIVVYHKMRSLATEGRSDPEGQV